MTSLNEMISRLLFVWALLSQCIWLYSIHYIEDPNYGKFHNAYIQLCTHLAWIIDESIYYSTTKINYKIEWDDWIHNWTLVIDIYIFFLRSKLSIVRCKKNNDNDNDGIDKHISSTKLTTSLISYSFTYAYLYAVYINRGWMGSYSTFFLSDTPNVLCMWKRNERVREETI